MNKLISTITQISDNTLFILAIAIVLVLAGLFNALGFCKSSSERPNVISRIKPNRLAESFNYRSDQELCPGYQQQFLVSSTLSQAHWYIVPEPEPTGLRLKTIVTR